MVFPSISKIWEELCHPTMKEATTMHYRMGCCWLSLSTLADLALQLHWGSPQMTAPNSASVLHSSPQGCFAHHETWGISAGSITKQKIYNTVVTISSTCLNKELCTLLTACVYGDAMYFLCSSDWIFIPYLNEFNAPKGLTMRSNTVTFHYKQQIKFC